MADDRQPAPGPGETVGHRHGWNGLDHYLTIVRARLEALEHEGMIVWMADPEPVAPGWIHFWGYVCCPGGIVVAFDKYLEVDPESRRVRVLQYSYNCSIQGHDRRDQAYGCFLRYDNSHGHGPDDDDPADQRTTWHHRHVWDVPNPDENDGVRTWIGEPGWEYPDDWPHFDEVVREALRWRDANSKRFALTDRHADPNRVEPQRVTPPGVGRHP